MRPDHLTQCATYLADQLDGLDHTYPDATPEQRWHAEIVCLGIASTMWARAHGYPFIGYSHVITALLDTGCVPGTQALCVAQAVCASGGTA